MHNNLVAVPGQAARETDACRVLGESSWRWNGKAWLRVLDFTYSYLESPSLAAGHSVRWPESILFLHAPCQLFEMNLSQLTSGLSLQRNGWEYTSLDKFLSANSAFVLSAILLT